MKKLVAFTCGSSRGNTEIFVKEALMAAKAKGVDVELIRLVDCDLHNCSSCVRCGAMEDVKKCPYGKDDCAWLMEKFLDSDGYIVGAPAYSLTPDSLFFAFRDRVFGPKMDVSAALKGMRPEPEWAKGRFKARPGALIGVGGALTEHWTSLNIPSLFTSTFSAQTEIVDTLNVYGMGGPNAAAGSEEWLAKAHRLGENVADAMLTGDHRWRGEREGSCPCCHQNLIQVTPGTDDVICPICGIRGKVSIKNGAVSFDWPEDWEHRMDNRLDVDGKLTHQKEIMMNVRQCMPHAEERKKKAEKYHTWTDCVQTPPQPSEESVTNA